MANKYDSNDQLPPLAPGELPPMGPEDPDVDQEWDSYIAGRLEEPNNPQFRWPPPTRRLRYKALDNYILYGIAKGEGNLDESALPAPHIKLSDAEYRDWISIRNYGAQRKTWYQQRDELVKKISGTAEKMTADKNPYAKKEKAAAVHQAQRHREYAIEKAQDELMALIRVPAPVVIQRPTSKGGKSGVRSIPIPDGSGDGTGPFLSSPLSLFKFFT